MTRVKNTEDKIAIEEDRVVHRQHPSKCGGNLHYHWNLQNKSRILHTELLEVAQLSSSIFSLGIDVFISRESFFKVLPAVRVGGGRLRLHDM